MHRYGDVLYCFVIDGFDAMNYGNTIRISDPFHSILEGCIPFSGHGTGLARYLKLCYNNDNFQLIQIVSPLNGLFSPFVFPFPLGARRC